MSGKMTDPQELRLAVVCSGGVSLAIYMHGLTKELHKLVRASRAFEAWWPGKDGGNPFEGVRDADSEYAYFEELRDLAEGGSPLSVTVDIIAGTSAGGINGVCLGKALACDGSQEGLKSLWINEGDLARLIDALPVGGWRTRAVLAGGRLLANPRTSRFPLLGRRMSCLLFDAIGSMQGPAGRSLVPAAGSLDLYVTTTDLHGFDVLVPGGAGGQSQRDADHAQVLRFRYAAGEADDFGADGTGSLAFAARATSCFPGAFPPVSVASFAGELGSDSKQRALHPELLAERFTRPYSETAGPLADAWFIDGGVLDNAPYDLVVAAIAGKRAETAVIRRLVYLSADPGQPVPKPAETTGAPGWLPSVWTALTSVKGSHPVLRDLLRLRDLNLRIGEVGAIAAAQSDQVLAILDRMDQPWTEVEFAGLRDMSDTVYQAAKDLVGGYYPTYCRLKLEAACRTLADQIARRFAYPPDSSHQSFLRAVLSAWGQNRPEWRSGDLDSLGALLGPADVPYRERRLLFMLSGVNALYQRQDAGGPAAADLNRLKAAAWDVLETVRGAPEAAAARVDPGLSSFLGAAVLGAAVLGDPAEFAAGHQAELAALFFAYSAELGRLLADSSRPVWQEFQRVSGGWDDRFRRELLSRYAGFPLWDALIFPTIALSELPQFTPIGVIQFSPVAAQALTAPEGAKLKGTSWHHFGGFLAADWRENDYLWGRLDGAELILRTLRAAGHPEVAEPSTVGLLTPGEAAAAAGPRLGQALRRILDAEAGLRRITPLRDSLRQQITAL